MTLTVEIAAALWAALEEEKCGRTPRPEQSCCVAHVACQTLIDMIKQHTADTGATPLEITMRGLARSISGAGGHCKYVKLNPAGDIFLLSEPRQIRKTD